MRLTAGQALETTFDEAAERLATVLPDAQLRDWPYELRAIVAGNQRTRAYGPAEARQS